MRECPNCHVATISRRKLYLSSLSIPGLICACANCHAIVYLENRSNIFKDIAVDILVVLIGLVFWYYTGSFYLGISAFIIWCLVKLYIKTNGKLDYSV